MGEPFVGEIRMFGGNFAPAGWSFCDGQLLPISENETLFNLIGTTYGGDGQETFALPNLQSRIPIHAGTGAAGTTYQLAETGGVESVTLTTQQIPIHSHVLTASGATATTRDPLQQNMLATSAGDTYVQSLDPVVMSTQAISGAGGNQPHENCQPFLCVNFILSLFGVFPQPS